VLTDADGKVAWTEEIKTEPSHAVRTGVTAGVLQLGIIRSYLALSHVCKQS
jgi:hypothetical protein